MSIATKKIRILPMALAAVFATTLANSAVAGIIYDVDRSWSEGSVPATLVGTVDVDLGTYNIQNGTPNPFNAVNLVLTVDGTSYSLTNTVLSLISGSGIFTIQATATDLIFSPSGTGSDPADLIFSDADLAGNRYIIGSNGVPAFERAITAAGDPIADTAPVFPLVWATVSVSVPEPTTLALLGLGLLGVGYRRRQRS